MDPSFNRFAALDVERTKDEDEDEDDHEHKNKQDQYYDSAKNPSDSLAWPLHERADDYTEQSSSPHALADLVALLDNNNTDGDLDATGSEDGSSDDSASAPVSPTAKICMDPWQLHTPHLGRHETSAFCSDHAIDGGSQTAEDVSRHMPWEEDDWDERKEWGIRALGWTRTRMLWRCTQGEEVEFFVGKEML